MARFTDSPLTVEEAIRQIALNYQEYRQAQEAAAAQDAAKPPQETPRKSSTKKPKKLTDQL